MERLVVHCGQINFVATNQLIREEPIVLPDLYFNLRIFELSLVQIRKLEVKTFVVKRAGRLPDHSSLVPLAHDLNHNKGVAASSCLHGFEVTRFVHSKPDQEISFLHFVILAR